MPWGVPTARILASGRSDVMASAMASNGLMCPAVPPPARTTERGLGWESLVWEFMECYVRFRAVFASRQRGLERLAGAIWARAKDNTTPTPHSDITNAEPP